MNKNILAEVQKMYDEAGINWHHTRSKKYKETGTGNWPVLQKYLDQVPSGSRILDVGCGNGRLVSGIKSQVSYLGIDFSRTLLDEAAKTYPEREFRYGNLVDPRVWDNIGQFEAIFCVAVLHHIPDKSQQIMILKQIKQALAPKGFVFLSVWNLWQERFLQYHLDSLELKKTNERWVEIPFQNKWKRFCFQMDIPYLMELMKEAGLNVTEIFFADQRGQKVDIQNGHNLVAIAR